MNKREIYSKVKRVVDSAQTVEQRIVARRYQQLAIKQLSKRPANNRVVWELLIIVITTGFFVTLAFLWLLRQ